jgi:benzoyl-CoA reductase/2-hydroxyglutaryl-CoA dehydratase subunit BcrC/BadD/HgdB
MTSKEIFAKLHEVAFNPKQQLDQYLADGKKVVLVTYYTPNEIIHSMGLVPMGVWGADIQLNQSKKYFPAFICSIMQSILELGINGAYKGASALVVPSLCDSLKCIGQNWKYAVKDIPFIPMSYPQNRKPDYGKRFTKAGYERVISDLEAITGAHFSDDNLRASNHVYNEHNAVMREFAEVASEYEVSAQERSDVFKSAWFMLPEEHTALVKELIERLKEGPKDSRKVRVLVSGILADAPQLLELFEKYGIKVAFDDVCDESRQYKKDVPETIQNPMDGLVEKFCSMDDDTLLYDADKKRVDYIVTEAQKHHAEGVIVLMTKFCDPEEFDYVPIKRACEKAGLHQVNIEVDRQMVNYEQAATQLEAFSELF